MVCVKLTLLVISQYMLISAPGPPLKKLTNEIKMETIAKNDDNIQRRVAIIEQMQLRLHL